MLDYFHRRLAVYAQKLGSARADQLAQLTHSIAQIRGSGKKLLIVGNGGSAAIASHVTVDFIKMAQVRALNFNDADLITCYANDYGYEEWVKRALASYADSGDMLILISSSGRSANILNGARFAIDQGLSLITFSGFAADNPLRQLGQLNFWVNSYEYNVVETCHQTWLLTVIDQLAGIDP